MKEETKILIQILGYFLAMALGAILGILAGRI